MQKYLRYAYNDKNVGLLFVSLLTRQIKYNNFIETFVL